uniref:DUF1275 domain-containing protein n=1 Tax=Acidobacterium capsulatum TaxID=33075 RepID=A0A7V5CS32_9BACT
MRIQTFRGVGIVSRSERGMLLILLAMAAGAADGWSFLGMGKAFVVNMTGNTVLLGISFFHLHGALHPAAALGGYVAGVVLASYVTGRHARRIQKDNLEPPKRVIWSRAVSWVLLAECVCLAAAEAIWFARCRGAGIPDYVPLVLLAICIGAQSGAMLQLQVPGIVTTYITGTWTQMVRGLTRVVTGEAISAPVEKPEFEEQLRMQGWILVAYFASAVLTGWLFHHAEAFTGVVPLICLGVAGIYGILRGGAYSLSD